MTNKLTYLLAAIALAQISKKVLGQMALFFALGPREALRQLYKELVKLLSPSTKRQIEAKVAESVSDIQKSLVPTVPMAHSSLPLKGMQDWQIRTEIQRYLALNKDNAWKSGKVSGAVYASNEELFSVLVETFASFLPANPLHPDIFGGVRQMEAEVVSIVLSLFNGPHGSCGNVTSGGTESLLMAIKTYRDLAEEAKGVKNPEIIAPQTIHAAFHKACHYFKIKLHLVPVDHKTGRVVISRVKRLINFNTIMLAGSAPNFPHGIIDDIPALSALAVRYNIPLHVDACLGGFLIPFAEKAGHPLPFPVDFRLKGVTSISVDTHKYGFAPKGSSIIMYRSSDIRKYQYFVTTEWPGGLYASPTIAGSRPGALVAACWAALLFMGQEGYVDSTRSILDAARKLALAVEAIPELEVIGSPLLSVVAFKSSKLPIYNVADILSTKGWHLNILQNPSAIHVAVTMASFATMNDLIKDIQQAVESVKSDPSSGKGDVAALYGSIATVPDRSILEDVAHGFLDALTMLK